MASLAESYPTMLAALAEHYGQPQAATPVRSAFEGVIVAALTRSGKSRTCRGGPQGPRQVGLLDPSALAEVERVEALDLLSESGHDPSGWSIGLLVVLARWYTKSFGSDEPAARSHDQQDHCPLRKELAAINGVGRTTADAILLALGRPAVPVDHGTYRILVRHGWIDSTTDYDEAGDLLSRQADGNAAEIARLTSWLATVGRQFCGTRSPECQPCPLRCVLPEQGPLDPDG